MSGEFSEYKESLVDKILEQGQQLRNAMVQSVLQTEPWGYDVFYNRTPNNTSASSATSLANKIVDNKLVGAFIRGDYLTKEQEEKALNTIRSMAPSDMCEATERTLLVSKCLCTTCASYHKNNLKCDLRRGPNCIKKPYMEPDDCAQLLKQVDSLKVFLHMIHLNDLGSKKVNQGSTKKHLSSCLSDTYFVEYYIPEVFTKEIPKSKSKVNSGLDNDPVRVCVRGTSNVIHIRQSYIHSVCNLYNYNLEDHDLVFYIRYKTKGQKKSELLGIAKFNLDSLKNSSKGSCGKTLPIHLNDGSPIVVGTLRVTLQLGAGKLYFGQEFIDAIFSRKSSVETNSSEEIIEDVSNKDNSKKLALSVQPKEEKEVTLKQEKEVTPKEQKEVTARQQKEVAKFVPKSKSNPLGTQSIIEKNELASILNLNNHEFQEDLLFGFLYISEAQFLNSCVNSYILCQPYCQTDTSASRVAYNSSNPLYNFCQTIPLIYDDNFLLKLRENFMIIEFWNKSDQADELIGLTKLPLHQFYLGYRNAIILKHLKRNQLPIIGTDWWEPIYSVDNKELIGQVQVLTALGTEDQIRHLELERGFKEDIVKAKFPVRKPTKKLEITKQPPNYFEDRAKINRTSLKLSSVLPKPADKVDVAVQSDIEINMEHTPKPTQTQEMLASFLKILEQKQRPPCVENGTNTDKIQPATSSAESETQPLRKTTDVLDSLQRALTLDNGLKKSAVKPAHFKVQITINSANQLPVRRKIKSKTKRNKSKSSKQEENILPSTYVTFESMPGDPLQITSVCPKSSSPQWNYRCEVHLPLDLLTNTQKRLIFKVWKKSTNVVLQPNMQTDLVLGFAALDISVLQAGLPNVQGWFNIMDFSGKCNGQINIHVNPLEKLQTISRNVSDSNCYSNSCRPTEECDEVLSRTLKRKFTELDEITQRLRLRLSEVVSEDSEGSNDDATEEFEHDINNLVIEEDFDLINFEEEARKFNLSHDSKRAENKAQNRSADKSQPSTSSSDGRSNEDSLLKQDLGKLKSDSSISVAQKVDSGNTTESSTSRSIFSDKHLSQGKHRIDTLLEKLSLITAEASNNHPFSSRYVSGCSMVSNDSNVQDIFTDLDQHSRPNITAANSLDQVLFQQLYGVSMSEVTMQQSNTDLLKIDSERSGGSDTSVITNFSECRPIPDGQGTNTEEKSS